MLVYSFVVGQNTYDQSESDLRDVHDWVCVVPGKKDNETSLKSAIRKLIIDSAHHVDKFLLRISDVALDDHTKQLRNKINDDYNEHENIGDLDEDVYKEIAEKHIEDLITIYHDFATTDNFRYLRYTCLPLDN